MNTTKTINLLEVARGALMEQINSALSDVIANIQDPNTDSKATRSLNVKITFKANEERDQITLAAQAKPTLAPVRPVATMLYASLTSNGVVVQELNKPDPQQVSIDEEMGTAETKVIQMQRRTV